MDVVKMLFTSVAGGLALIVVALLIRWKKPGWTGFRTLLFGAAGFAALPLIAPLMSTFIANDNKPRGASNGNGWLQEVMAWLGRICQPIPSVGGAFHTFFGAIATYMTWIVAFGLAAVVVLDMFPRVRRLRDGGGQGMGGGRQSIGGRVAALHEAQPHTAWAALFVCAAASLVGPLAHAFGLGA